MNPTGKRWLVIRSYQVSGEIGTKAHSHPIGKIHILDGIGCVRAENENHANKEGYDLLGLEITQAIPLSEIFDGWIYRGDD